MRWKQPIEAPTGTVGVGRWLAGLSSLTLLAIGAGANMASAASNPSQPAKPLMAPDQFPVAGKPIRVERFEPAAPGKYPAIILVHAVDGVEAHGRRYREQATKYASKGYVVLLVHYFEVTDRNKENLKDIQESFRLFFDPESAKKPNDLRAMRKHFTAWKEAVREAVRYATSLPNVDSRRIGLAGFSLGAALALAAAGEEDPEKRQIATVVSLFGCLPPDLREEIRGLPPTLMLQGDVDERVPPRAAYDFERWLKRKKLPVQFKMCQRVGHVFDGAGLQDMLDAQDLVEAFLKTRLRPRSPGRPLLDAPVSGQGGSPARR
jgi:carboxymethylenebutenolidase